MITKFRSERSFHGHSLDVLKSALQKYIRRGEEDKAMYVAAELDMFADEGKPGERIRTNFIHRLQIIFLEDVGGGNLELWGKMCEWITILWNERKKESDRNRGKEIRCIRNIVIHLCRSRKARIASHLNALTKLRKYKKSDEELVARSEYTQIMTEEEENMSFQEQMKELEICLENRSWRSALFLRSLVIKVIKKTNLRNILNKFLEKYFRFMECSLLWQKDILKLKEGYILYFLPLADFLYGMEPLQVWDKKDDIEDLDNNWDMYLEQVFEFEFEDYVYDRHVKKTKNRDISYFKNISAMVIPEVVGRYPDILKKIYNPPCISHSDVDNDDFPNNEKEMDFVVRAQLTCGNNKTDTYYTKWKGKIWFVKGPYVNTDKIEKFIEFQKYKKEMGLPFVNSKMTMMVPDLEETAPLGLRNKLDVSIQHPFLICESLIENIQTKVHPGSKKWSPTEIADTTEIELNEKKLENETLMLDYLNSIAFRIKHNIGDWADRNFIIYKERLYSVDEEPVKTKVSLERNVKKNRRKLIFENFHKMKKKMHPDLVPYIQTMIPP